MCGSGRLRPRGSGELTCERVEGVNSERSTDVVMDSVDGSVDSGVESREVDSDACVCLRKHPLVSQVRKIEF